MTKVLLLNGPPRSGKDFGGGALVRDFDGTACVAKFAHVLKERTHAAYGVMHHGRPAPHDWFETQKDSPVGEFLGRTPREAYIAFSEQFMKPLHGDNIFGRLLLADLRQGEPHDLIVVTDSGFRSEAEVLVRFYGEHNVTHVRLHRPGRTFTGDSRTYIDLSDLGVTPIDIHNDTDEDTLVARLKEALHG
jgi:hypothetical protein